jgi:hypothetical protein
MAKSVTLGTIMRVENPATAGYIVVGNLTSIVPPGPEKNEIDVTDLDSVAFEYLMGLPDLGEMSGSGWFNYADAGQLVLFNDALDPDAPARAIQIDFTRQDVRLEFDALVKSFKPTVPGPNDAYGFDFAVRLTGSEGITKTSPIPA